MPDPAPRRCSADIADHLGLYLCSFERDPMTHNAEDAKSASGVTEGAKRGD
jgi:hypothetical protein